MWRLGLEATAIAALVAYLLTPLVIRFAIAVGAVDHPGPRKVHAEPIPRIGGVAVFAGFLAGTLYAGFVTGYVANVSMPRATYWLALAWAGGIVFLLGLFDDLVGISFRWKFAIQILAAAVVWAGGFRISAVGIPFGGGDLHLGWASFIVTVLWVVGITNAVNLIDGLDGLAAGTAIITTSAIGAVAYYSGQQGVMGVCAAVVGSLLGFLRYNFNPARIFLGDSGAMFLGFVLAVMSIHGASKGPTLVAVMTPLLVLGFPILDTGVAILRRLYRIASEGARRGSFVRHFVGNFHRVFLPDRGHIHHRLLDMGMSHRGAVITIYVVALVFGATALFSVAFNDPHVGATLFGVLSLCVLGFVAIVLMIGRRRARDRIGHRGAPPPAGGAAAPAGAAKPR